MTIDQSELASVATQVWQLIMQSEIVPALVEGLSSDAAPQVAHISLSGAYTCEVALQLDTRLIKNAAATMFGIEAEDVTEVEMADTARELANMVGGNVKCLVEQPTDLGLPQITPADEFHRKYTAASCQLAFEYEGAPMYVSVYDRAA
ncbi:MAG: chemotaxis protein CheX [Myxococcota bacterium]